MLDLTLPTLESVMAAPAKPAKSYVAKAIPIDGGGFLAQWAAPGLVPDLVDDRRTGTPKVYRSADEAEAAALRTMLAALNTRRGPKSKNEFHDKMTGAEFAVKLAEANITPTLWAQLYGSKPERVIDQLDSNADVPFAAHWILEVLKDPAALKTAITITAQHMRYKQEFLDYLERTGMRRVIGDEDFSQIPIEMTRRDGGET